MYTKFEWNKLEGIIEKSFLDPHVYYVLCWAVFGRMLLIRPQRDIITIFDWSKAASCVVGVGIGKN